MPPPWSRCWARGADQIVLGCTHYPFLTPVMERIVDGRAAIVDPSPAVARRVGQLFDRYGLRASADNRPRAHVPHLCRRAFTACVSNGRPAYL